MQDNPKKDQNSSVSVICILGACYLIYTAVQMFSLLGSGQADSPVLCAVGGGFLGLCGCALMVFQWRAYRKDKQRIKDEIRRDELEAAQEEESEDKE